MNYINYKIILENKKIKLFEKLTKLENNIKVAVGNRDLKIEELEKNRPIAIEKNGNGDLENVKKELSAILIDVKKIIKNVTEV